MLKPSESRLAAPGRNALHAVTPFSSMPKAEACRSLPGLYNAPHPGHPATMGQRVPAQLEQLLAHGPNHCGSIEAGWTVELRRAYRAQHQGSASDATVRRQLQAGDGVYKRCATTVPRNAPTAEQNSPGGRHDRRRQWPPRTTACSSLFCRCIPLYHCTLRPPRLGAHGPTRQSPYASAAAKYHPVWRVTSAPPTLLLEAGYARHLHTLSGVSASAPSAVS